MNKIKTAYFDTFPANDNFKLCFNHNHLYNVLNKEFQETKVKNSDYYIILDVGLHLDNRIEHIYNLRRQGTKVILITFDPANFIRVRNYISKDMIDKVIVFDKQFLNSFPGVKVYWSDYFFNIDLFPKISNYEDKYFSEVVTFGHMSHGRNNDFGLERIDLRPEIKNYYDLYTEVQKYNGVAVYDTGLDETHSNIVHYNKAKCIETLMIGRNPYCQSGINTKRYNKYIKKYEEIPNIKPIDFNQLEIFRINDLTIKELVYEIEQT